MVNPCIWMRDGSSERSSQWPQSRASRVMGLAFALRLIAAALPCVPPCASQTRRRTHVQGKRNDPARTRDSRQAQLVLFWRDGG